MVCSEKELGLSDEHEGIMVLEADAPVGAPLAEWLGDTVIEFEITPNLVHAFSILGIAREAGALTDRPVATPPIVRSRRALPPVPADLVTVEAPDLCARYVAVVIEGVTVGPSPAWLQRRLLAAGVRPINNDRRCHQLRHARVRPAAARLRRRPPGGRAHRRPPRAAGRDAGNARSSGARSSTPEMLVIADRERAVGLAGVMGGVDSEVTDDTRRILLESANFDMKSVRRTARELKLRTDASARFERGLDPNLARDAAARATRLILDLSPGATVTAVADVYPQPLTPRPLSLPFTEIERLLGVRYDRSRCSTS